jgi:hypothetical protein
LPNEALKERSLVDLIGQDLNHLLEILQQLDKGYQEK